MSLSQCDSAIKKIFFSSSPQFAPSKMSTGLSALYLQPIMIYILNVSFLQKWTFFSFERQLRIKQCSSRPIMWFDFMKQIKKMTDSILKNVKSWTWGSLQAFKFPAAMAVLSITDCELLFHAMGRKGKQSTFKNNRRTDSVLLITEALVN